MHWLQTAQKEDYIRQHTGIFLEDLNTFYTRYDVLYFSYKQTEELEVLLSLENDRVDVTETEVRNILKGSSSRKATGPDGISKTNLNMCSGQLAGVFARLFQLSLNTNNIPML